MSTPLKTCFFAHFVIAVCNSRTFGDMLPLIVAWSRRDGVPLDAIFATEQGTRRKELEPVKELRCVYMARLHSMGATMPAIGRLFGGRSEQAVAYLIKKGQAVERARKDQLLLAATADLLPHPDAAELVEQARLAREAVERAEAW